MADHLDLIKSLVAVVALPNGHETATPLGALNAELNYQMQVLIIQGCRIGSCVTMSALLFMVASSWTSALFILYQLNFLFLFLSSVFSMITRLRPIKSILFYLTADVSLGTANDRSCVAAGAVFTILLIWSLVATLLFQIHTAYGDTRRFRWPVSVASAIACVPCVLIWAWFCIYTVVVTFDPTRGEVDSMGNIVKYAWVGNSAWPVFAATTGFCSLMLCVRLYFACRARARLGLEKFDPLRVVLTMSLHNSVVPVVIAIIVAAGQGHIPSSLEGIVTLITTVFLPLGYIWAQFRRLQIAAGAVSSDGHHTMTYQEHAVEKMAAGAYRLRNWFWGPATLSVHRDSVETPASASSYGPSSSMAKEHPFELKLKGLQPDSPGWSPNV